MLYVTLLQSNLHSSCTMYMRATISWLWLWSFCFWVWKNIRNSSIVFPHTVRCHGNYLYECNSDQLPITFLKISHGFVINTLVRHSLNVKKNCLQCFDYKIMTDFEERHGQLVKVAFVKSYFLQNPDFRMF